eukprot:1849446-Ditylum_brightwellii.AAC.1
MSVMDKLISYIIVCLVGHFWDILQLHHNNSRLGQCSNGASIRSCTYHVGQALTNKEMFDVGLVKPDAPYVQISLGNSWTNAMDEPAENIM